jgi:hypothetical protein
MVARRDLGGIYRGTNAERVALVPPAAGWIFIETDFLGIYYWDGSYWGFLGTSEALGRKTGFYNTFSETVNGQGILEGLQGYGNLSATFDANGFWHQWTTGTTAETIGGVVKQRTGGFTRRNVNPLIRFKGFFYPKTAGDSRMYMGYYQPVGHIPKTDTPLGSADKGFLFGWRSTDTNFMIFPNDGLQACTPIDTGIALPVGITGYILELRGNSTGYTWALFSLLRVLTASGSVTSQVPGNATGDTVNIHAVTTNPTGASKALTFMGFEVGVDK